MNKNILNEYLVYCKLNKRLSAHSLRVYKNDISQFLSYEHSNISEYCNFLSNKIKKNSTLKRKLSSIKTFYA